jgi:UDPglucose 6-dehydrogenase
MNSAIVLGGSGMVGNATMYSLGIKDQYSRGSSTVDINHILDFKYVFICLPTPTVDGKQDLSLIEYYLRLFSERSKSNIFIIRSTVLPGTCKRLSDKYGLTIVHVPEFLTEATWKEDSEWPDIVVIGSDDNYVGEQVAGVFKARFKGATFVCTDTVTSELIKYSINTFYALKVVFANQIFDYAKLVGANYNTVKESMYARKFMSKNHFDVHHQGGKGAGGKCLEKDLEAFATESKLELFELANKINKELLKKYPKKNGNK